MKLRHRISLLAGAVLLLVLLVCAGVLLLYARRTILSLAEDQARDKQQALANSFSSMAQYYAVSDDSDSFRESLVRYCFARFADREGVLIRDGDILLSSVSVDPSRYAQPDRQTGDVGVFRGPVDGRQLLIVGSQEWVYNETYYVGLVRDITEVYDAILRLTRLFLLVCLGGVALGMGLLFFVVKGSTAPLSRLTAAARQIAAGAYDRRVQAPGRDEVSELAASFNHMAQAVESRIDALTEQNERQRLFIGGVSHEFKTPLAALSLHASLLDGAKLSDEERADSLRYIQGAGAYMSRMIQSLMSLLLLDRGIETQPARPAAVLQEAEQLSRRSLQSRGVTLQVRCDSDDTLPMDATLMVSLLMNLLENAARSYEPDAAEKPVFLTYADRTFTVSDRGRGIPAEAQGRIFEPFYRVDKARSRKQGGSGLGLALVKAIADAHGARLSLESEPGKGTTFRVSF